MVGVESHEQTGRHRDVSRRSTCLGREGCEYGEESADRGEAVRLLELDDRPVRATGLLRKKHINELEKDPRPSGMKKLAGTGNGYRVRAGDYRILYTIDDRQKIVTVYGISSAS